MGFYSYYGIPYAEATQRFEAAKPVKPWRVIRMATQVGPHFTQAQRNFPNGEWGNRAASLLMDSQLLEPQRVDTKPHGWEKAPRHGLAPWRRF